MPSLIDQIARKANVSKCTVYRALKGDGKEVWKSARSKAEHIRSIARDLGYRSNAAARSMREGMFRQIACVTTRVKGAHSKSLVGYLDSATEIMQQQGYLLVLENFVLESGSGDITEPLKLFSENSVDGVLAIVSSGYFPREIEESLVDLQLPTVWVNHKTTVPGASVISDESQAIRDMIVSFKKYGHRKLVFLAPEYGHYSVSFRIDSIKNAAREEGLDLSVITSSKRPIYVREMAESFFTDHSDATGVICYTNSFFEIFLLEAAKRGVSVPGDVSVACFASLDLSDIESEFPLSVIRVPEKGMIDKGAEILFDMIDRNVRKEGEYKVPASFVAGETVGPVRDK